MIKTIGERIQKVAYKAYWSLNTLRNQQDVSNLHRIYHEPTGAAQGRYDSVFRYSGAACIEPEYGYVISTSGHVVEQSLVPNLDWDKPPWRIAMPNPARFKKLGNRIQSSPLYYPTVVTLRHFWEWNYFHFYADVLGRLKLLDSLGLDKSIPIALGNYVDDVPFAKQILKIGRLAERTWILPGHNFIHADEIYILRTQQSWQSRFSYLVDQMDLPEPDVNSTDRIYLNRPRTGTRTVVNQSEIDPVLARHGFREVDTTGMAIKDQISLFSSARHVVAIHGAGLINIIFRDGAPLSLLELRSDTYTTEDFQNISKEYGYQPSILVGRSNGESPQHANFFVDPAILEKKILELTEP